MDLAKRSLLEMIIIIRSGKSHFVSFDALHVDFTLIAVTVYSVGAAIQTYGGAPGGEIQD